MQTTLEIVLSLDPANSHYPCADGRKFAELHANPYDAIEAARTSSSDMIRFFMREVTYLLGMTSLELFAGDEGEILATERAATFLIAHLKTLGIERPDANQAPDAS